MYKSDKIVNVAKRWWEKWMKNWNTFKFKFLKNLFKKVLTQNTVNDKIKKLSKDRQTKWSLKIKQRKLIVQIYELFRPAILLVIKLRWNLKMKLLVPRSKHLCQIKIWNICLNWEFDPGSGRTLAACLTHASRAMKFSSESGLAADGWVTRG